MSLRMTRRSFLGAAGAGALAVGGLGKPGEALAQAKPAKLNVLQEDFEPISSWVAKRYQAKHGIEVVYTTTEFTANYEKQVADMISGSATSLYDVVQWSDPFTGVFAPKGYIEPLDAYLQKSTVLKLDEIKGPWVPAATYKGKVYGLPFHNLDMQLFYRKDVIPQAPRTYQEILEWAKKVNKSPQFYGFTGDWDDDNFWYNFRRRLFAAGGGCGTRTGTPRSRATRGCGRFSGSATCGRPAWSSRRRCARSAAGPTTRSWRRARPRCRSTGRGRTSPSRTRSSP